jgi:hypothetical protein
LVSLESVLGRLRRRPLPTQAPSQEDRCCCAPSRHRPQLQRKHHLGAAWPSETHAAANGVKGGGGSSRTTGIVLEDILQQPVVLPALRAAQGCKASLIAQQFPCGRGARLSAGVIGQRVSHEQARSGQTGGGFVVHLTPTEATALSPHPSRQSPPPTTVQGAPYHVLPAVEGCFFGRLRRRLAVPEEQHCQDRQHNQRGSTQVAAAAPTLCAHGSPCKSANTRTRRRGRRVDRRMR